MSKFQSMVKTCILVSCLALGCSGSDERDGEARPQGGGGSGANGGTGGSGTSGGGSSGTSPGGIPRVPGVPDDSVDTALPRVPAMVNVRATVSGDSVSITYDPIDGAPDYRVYELPADSEITTTDDGTVVIPNATYRCAGTRQTPPATMDGATQIQSGAIKTLVDGQDVRGYTRSLEDATLGYVSAVPRDGLVPVYALGHADQYGDNTCYFMRWRESRTKKYVTSTSERDSLLAEGYRDDGIVFYAPEGGDGTRLVSTSTEVTGGITFARFYFTDGPEAAVRSGAEPAFSVFTEGSDELQPLMRVFYAHQCGTSHDELVPGMARFDRARRQGDSIPMYDLHWSGITGPTTLVIEALDQGCPNQPGLLAPKSSPAFDVTEHGEHHPAWVTVDEARAAAADGELFINGQFDPANRPKAVARSFVRVSPTDAPDLDWFTGFGPEDSLGMLVERPDCGRPEGCFQEFRFSSEVTDLQFNLVETERHAWGTMFGELWVMYADVASDVNGKFRLTPNARGTMSADSFLYVTMEVNAFTTARRYPQILVSDQEPPVTYTMINGNSIVIQTFSDWPYLYELQVCDHRWWDVNDQCPRYDLYRQYDPSDNTQIVGLAPNEEVGEHTGMDRSTHFEAYLSTRRAYLLLDGQPYGCVDLPTAGIPSGQVSVTFGDVLYHSGADTLNFYNYVESDFNFDTQRHFDNLGFKSGVTAPEWDESRFPCVSKLAPY